MTMHPPTGGPGGVGTQGPAGPQGGVGTQGPAGPQGPAGADGTGGGVLDPSLYPTLAQVATVEDITIRRAIEAVSYVSNVAVVNLGPAFALARVVAASLSSDTLTLGTSNSNYHIVDLVKWPEAGFAGSTPAPVVIGTKTFQVGSDGMVPLYAWHFGSVILDPVAQIVQPLDLIGFRLTKVGATPPASMSRVVFTVRAEPKRDGA